MNTGEFWDNKEEKIPVIWCDIDGWGDTIRRQGFPDDPYHFCHRHNADEVKRFMNGELKGYFEK